jgi:hypothetical protein
MQPRLLKKMLRVAAPSVSRGGCGRVGRPYSNVLLFADGVACPSFPLPAPLMPSVVGNGRPMGVMPLVCSEAA